MSPFQKLANVCAVMVAVTLGIHAVALVGDDHPSLYTAFAPFFAASAAFSVAITAAVIAVLSAFISERGVLTDAVVIACAGAYAAFGAALNTYAVEAGFLAVVIAACTVFLKDIGVRKTWALATLFAEAVVVGATMALLPSPAAVFVAALAASASLSVIGRLGGDRANAPA